MRVLCVDETGILGGIPSPVLLPEYGERFFMFLASRLGMRTTLSPIFSIPVRQVRRARSGCFGLQIQNVSSLSSRFTG
jgi:hypothetical protein